MVTVTHTHTPLSSAPVLTCFTHTWNRRHCCSHFSIVAALDQWMRGLHPQTELPPYLEITNHESPFTMPGEQWKSVEMELKQLLTYAHMVALLKMVDDFRAIGSSRGQLSQSCAAHTHGAAQLDHESLCCWLFVCLALVVLCTSLSLSSSPGCLPHRCQRSIERSQSSHWHTHISCYAVFCCCCCDARVLCMGLTERGRRSPCSAESTESSTAEKSQRLESTFLRLQPTEAVKARRTEQSIAQAFWDSLPHVVVKRYLSTPTCSRTLLSTTPVPTLTIPARTRNYDGTR
jgi:hypothetical protein